MKYFEEYFQEAIETLSKLPELSSKTYEVATVIVEALTSGKSIYWFGNGGSASDAEHLAAELAGKFKIDREPLSSYSLTSNSSLITAISNDYGFENVFARQVRGYVSSGDIVIGISTSGASLNVINGLLEATSKSAITVALVGSNTFNLPQVNYTLSVPSDKTAHIQEAHITIGQAICGFVESKFIKK